MSNSTRNHDKPAWLRVRMIANSRAHRAMKSQALKLPAHLCPTIDEWFKEFQDGLIDVRVLRNRLGQVHTDYVNALEQAHVGWIKTRIRLWLQRKKNANAPETRKNRNASHAVLHTRHSANEPDGGEPRQRRRGRAAHAAKP